MEPGFHYPVEIGSVAFGRHVLLLNVHIMDKPPTHTHTHTQLRDRTNDKDCKSFKAKDREKECRHSY